MTCTASLKPQAYLGINVDMHIPKPEPEPNYRDVLSREVVERLTRARRDDALSETGCIPGVEVEDARLAYIQATQGRRAMREAYKAMQDATEGRDPARRELEAPFHRRLGACTRRVGRAARAHAH